MSLALRLAYAANIAILLPVVTAIVTTDTAHATVFEGKLAQSRDLQLLVGCLWAGILVASVIGLVVPSAMAGVLVMQVIYKSLFLALWAWPAYRLGGTAALPLGLTVSFAAIVAVYPWIVWAWWRS